MDVTIGLSAFHQWPDHARRSLELRDGLVVTPESPVGIIDYYRNIDRLNRDGSLIGFSRALIADMTSSLTILASEVQTRERTPNAPMAFTGMSHLARLANRFGFTVFDITDDRRRERATDVSFQIAAGIASNNPEWQQLKEKYKPAQVAMISREGLMQKYHCKK